MKTYGRLLGLPYDFRPPTWRRARDLSWNSDDPSLFTPKVFGWGYSINFYWFCASVPLVADPSGGVTSAGPVAPGETT